MGSDGSLSSEIHDFGELEAPGTLRVTNVDARDEDSAVNVALAQWRGETNFKEPHAQVVIEIQRHLGHGKFETEPTIAFYNPPERAKGE
jgi:hypothetical protein